MLDSKPKAPAAAFRPDALLLALLPPPDRRCVREPEPEDRARCDRVRRRPPVAARSRRPAPSVRPCRGAQAPGGAERGEHHGASCVLGPLPESPSTARRAAIPRRGACSRRPQPGHRLPSRSRAPALRRRRGWAARLRRGRGHRPGCRRAFLVRACGEIPGPSRALPTRSWAPRSLSSGFSACLRPRRPSASPRASIPRCSNRGCDWPRSKRRGNHEGARAAIVDARRTFAQLPRYAKTQTAPMVASDLAHVADTDWS